MFLFNIPKSFRIIVLTFQNHRLHYAKAIRSRTPIASLKLWGSHMIQMRTKSILLLLKVH